MGRVQKSKKPSRYQTGWSGNPYTGLTYRVSEAAIQAASVALAQKYGNTSSKTTTNTEQKKSGRRGRITSAYYAGKYGRKRFRRASKYQRRRYKQAFAGTLRVIERTATVTDDRCVYLSHCTFPPTEIAKQIIYVLVKRLANNCGVVFSSFDDPSSQYFATGNSVSISYKPNITSAPISLGYTVLAGDLTYRNVAEGLWTIVFNSLINSSTGFTSQSIMNAAIHTSSAAIVVSRVNLMDAAVSVYSKSSLKMQNRSVSVAADNESDDINNVPLTGRGYEGRGNGFVTRDNNLILAPCTLDYAWNQVGAGSTVNLQEPPQVFHLQYAKGMKKANIQPGRIKTSILTNKQYMNLNRFFALVNGLYISATDTNQYHGIGRVRMYALERAIARMGSDSSPAITINAEHDIKMWIDVKTKRGIYTGPDNFVQ